MGTLPVDAHHSAFKDRVLQTLAIYFYLLVGYVAPLCQLVLFFMFRSSPLFWLLLGLYLAWFITDFKTPYRGSGFNKTIHYWPLWSHLANFFPIEVHRTAELPPDTNYIICMHPHGVLGTTSLILLATGGCNFRKMFPGVKMRAATLSLNFWFPLRREFIMGLGLIPCDSEAIEFVLSRPEKGFAVGIAPGGAAEALESHPNRHRLVLSKRKGFVRLAIKHGASIVPCYHFGETSLLHQIENPEGSLLRKFQLLMKRLTMMSFPLAYGQNILGCLLPPEWVSRLPWWMTIGLVPFRQRIVSVVGSPIAVEMNPNPSQEQIDRVHAQYCAGLHELFHKYKGSHGGLPDAELELI